jgi:hypothetical protein
MVADPEPGDLVIFHDADRSATTSDAKRIDGLSLVHLLEPKARVPRVLPKEPIGLPSELSGLWR